MRIGTMAALTVLASTAGEAAAGITILQIPPQYQLDAGRGAVSIAADGGTALFNVEHLVQPDQGTRAVIWDVGAGLTFLVVPGPSGEGVTSSGQLSADGNRAIVTSGGFQNIRVPFLWERGHGFTALGPAGNTQCFGGAISRNGEFMSGFTGELPFIQRLPTTVGGPPGPIVSLQGSSNTTLGSPWVSNDGQSLVILTIVGGGYSVGWRALTGPGFTLAGAIDNQSASDGTTAGIYGLGNERRAFFSGPQSLHVLTGVPFGPGTSHEAIAVATGGSAVLGWSFLADRWVFWYWTPILRTVPLSRVIDPLPPNLVIEDVFSMTDDGQHIMGSAYDLTTGAESIWMASVSIPGCGSADFDGDGDAGTDADITAFFSCLAGNCCDVCVSADFNTDGDVGTDQDIEAFFRVLAGGSCWP